MLPYSELETQRIEFKGLITSTKTKIDHIAWEILVKISISTLKRIDERNGWFNGHRDKGGLNVHYQRIKLPINKTIGETLILREKNANVLC